MLLLLKIYILCVSQPSAHNDRGHQDIYIKHYKLQIVCVKVHMIHKDVICFLFVTYLQLPTHQGNTTDELQTYKCRVFIFF